MRAVFLAALLFFIVIMPSPCFADNTQDQLRSLNLDGIQNYVNRLNDEISGALPTLNFKEMVMDLVSGKASLSPGDLVKKILSYMFREVVADSSLLGKLILLAVVCAVLQNLQSAFEASTTAKLSYAVSYLLLISLAIGSFSLAVSTGRNLVGDMVSFMQALMPVLITLLVALGGITPAALFHPLIFSFITLMSTIIGDFVLPLLVMAAALKLAGNLSERFQVSRMAGLIQWVAMGTMGLFSTIFLGLLSIYGISGAVSNGIAMRTAKFATDTFVPVVGRMFSDAMGAVVGTSLLLKNAIGLAGILVIGLMIVVPLVKIVSLGFIYNLAGAIVQPIGDSRMSECLSGLGQSLFLIFASVSTVGLLFFFTIAIVVGVGNLTTLLH